MGRKPVLFMLVFTAIIMLLFLIMQPLTILNFQNYISLLFPSGSIAVKERNLLLIIQALMLLVIVPVYILTFIFSWKYRAHRKKSDYDPDLVDNYAAEVVWWGLPLVMTAIVAVITVVKTYELDPFRPIESDKPTKTIQVVAMQWKWLFIYPEEQVASLNFLQIPENTPIHFEITADAPMNSFWIPSLGGQIYAMPAMKTELHLIADQEGDFRGSSANISGEGFANMHFITRASSQEAYDAWIKTAQESKQLLDMAAYQQLAQPSTNQPEQFQLKEADLFHAVLMKYMP